MTRWEAAIKRILDVLIPCALILILLPLFMMVALLIRLDSQGGVIYRQARAGRNGAPFYLYKFRSMVVNAEHQGAGYYFSGPDDPRITRVGRVLRNTSLDELPQLFNVLKGDMSIVGPRPCLPYQVELFNVRQQRRLEVKPGITGWAQINGRNNQSWSKRIEYDLWYLDHYSLWLDFKILFKTIGVVFSGSGISYDVTPEKMEDFGPPGAPKKDGGSEVRSVRGK
ncbi:MAG TPA: sugar transferase [Desulfotomaculum sp.]|nr:sugar transferase [Desulfotomaculum sp.]